MQGSKKNQMIPIYVFGNYIGHTSCQANRIRRNAEITYLRYRLKQQDYENRILTVRL